MAPMVSLLPSNILTRADSLTINIIRQIVELKKRSGEVIKKDLNLGVSADEASVEDLSRAIFKAYPKWDITRQRLTTVDNKVLEKGKSLKSYGITNGSQVVFKDLGPQIGWSTVFVIEYLGPLLIHPFFYFNQKLIYGSEAPMTQAQTWTLILVMFHFLKREFETLFIHKFSNDTMPLRNLPKNCAHYWVLGGLFLAAPIYRPGFVGFLGGGIPESMLNGLLGFFFYAQFSNLITHKILSDLRPPGSRVRKIPFGYGFNYVSCPNYFFEILGWVAITALNGSLVTLLFAVVGAVQMYVWAVKKHKRYLKEFGDKYPRNRKILVPFLL
ncbi:3-oxo-5a-steroid 4- dehydrogenase [Chytriomyces hyalinus]|nr:3-oxo-5a-steroid 4- dehydrogenase [Chytriomyces hyalinus]